jgi:hypothetical protein
MSSEKSLKRKAKVAKEGAISSARSEKAGGMEYWSDGETKYKNQK